MFCKNCGTPVNPDQAFCPSCGFRAPASDGAASAPGSTGGFKAPSGLGEPEGGHAYNPSEHNPVTPPPSGGYTPPSGGYTPPSGGYTPPSGGYTSAPAPVPAPASTGYNPPSGGYGSPYGGYGASPGGYRPMYQLSISRGLLKFILLNLITCGIYSLVAMSSISNDINIIASRYDGRKTMHYCLLYFIVAPITCGIGSLVWNHNICDRIGNELRRRGIPYSFGASDFWIWNTLGILIIVGPFIYLHRLFKAMNLISYDFNLNG